MSKHLSKDPKWSSQISQALFKLSPESLNLLLILEKFIPEDQHISEADLLNLTQQWVWLQKYGPRKFDILQECLTELVAQQWLFQISQQPLIYRWSPSYLEKNSVENLIEISSVAVDEQRLNELHNLQVSIAKCCGGALNPSLLDDIRLWFLKENIEPALIYYIFEDVFNRKKTINSAYLRKIFSDLRSENIRTFAAYEKKIAGYQEGEKRYQYVEKLLKRKFNLKEREYISRWWDELKYDLPVIELAIACSTYSQGGEKGLPYFNKILQNWFDLGLKNEEEIKEYLLKEEKNRSKQKQAKMKAEEAHGGNFSEAKTKQGYQNRKTRAANVGNFEQRTYDEDYLKSLLNQDWHFLDKEDQK